MLSVTLCDADRLARRGALSQAFLSCIVLYLLMLSDSGAVEAAARRRDREWHVPVLDVKTLRMKRARL